MTMNLRAWLLKSPRPTRLVLQMPDGQAIEQLIPQHQTWNQTADTVSAMQPMRVEAYAGQVMCRAAQFSDFEPEETEETEGAHPFSGMKLTGQVDAQVLITLATIVAQAYRHSTDVAFDRMVSLFEAVNQRSATQEKTLDAMHKMLTRVLNERYEEIADQKPQEDGLMGLVNSFVGGVSMGQQAPASPPKTTNGKA